MLTVLGEQAVADQETFALPFLSIDGDLMYFNVRLQKSFPDFCRRLLTLNRNNGFNIQASVGKAETARLVEYMLPEAPAADHAPEDVLNWARELAGFQRENGCEKRVWFSDFYPGYYLRDIVVYAQEEDPDQEARNGSRFQVMFGVGHERDSNWRAKTPLDFIFVLKP